MSDTHAHDLLTAMLDWRNWADDHPGLPNANLNGAIATQVDDAIAAAEADAQPVNWDRRKAHDALDRIFDGDKSIDFTTGTGHWRLTLDCISLDVVA